MKGTDGCEGSIKKLRSLQNVYESKTWIEKLILSPFSFAYLDDSLSATQCSSTAAFAPVEVDAAGT
jgi:hypothetical protein